MSFNFSKDNLIETEKGRLLLVYWLKRIFIDDWLMKLVALIITFALWLGVTGLQAPISRPLNNITLNPLLSKDLEITNDFVKEVDLELTGDKSKVDNINPRDLVVRYDVTDLQPGEREVNLTAQNIKIDLPSGVTVTKITPEKIVLKIEEVMEVEVPVVVETYGVPSEGLEVYNTNVVPDKVRVRGPKSFVESLDYVPTEQVDLNGRNGDFVAQKIPIDVSDSKNISLVDSVTVQVSFKIGKKRIERLFVVPYEIGEKRGRISVRLYGSETVLENITKQDIFVVEDEDNPNKLRVMLPEDIQNEVEIRRWSELD